MSTEITTTGTKDPAMEDNDTARKPKKLTDSQLLDWYEDTFSGLVDDTTGALLAVAKDRWIASPVADDAAGLLYSQAVKLGRAETGYLPTPNAIKSAIAGFKAGSGDWPVHPIPYRMTRVGDEIWVDGGQPREHDRTVWHITPDIIEELKRPAQGIVFRRSRRTAPMPRPDLDVDWERSMADYVKLFLGFNKTQVKLSWLWDAYCYAHPSEKIPIKNLSGPAGYGKSSVMDTDIILVDNALAVKGGNRGVRLREKCDDDDLASVAAQSYLAAFDNLSNVSEHSDLLTSFSTGGTLAKRQLYTDTEMASVTMLKPTILTAITLRGVGADLASRFIEITAEHKPPYNANWESWRDGLIPGILGGCCGTCRPCSRSRRPCPTRPCPPVSPHSATGCTPTTSSPAKTFSPSTSPAPRTVSSTTPTPPPQCSSWWTWLRKVRSRKTTRGPWGTCCRHEEKAARQHRQIWR